MTAPLVGPVWRSLPWRVLGAGGGVGLLVAGGPVLAGAEPAPWQTLLLVRSAALIGALGLAFVLDDPARELTAAVPVRRLVRQGVRVALVAPFAVVWWVGVLLLTPSAVRPPVGGVSVEAAVAGLAALAGAAAVVRLTDEARPGARVAVTLLLAAVLVPLLAPEGWALFVPADDPRWGAAHVRWAVLGAGVALVGVGCGAEGRRGA